MSNKYWDAKCDKINRLWLIDSIFPNEYTNVDFDVISNTLWNWHGMAENGAIKFIANEQ